MLPRVGTRRGEVATSLRPQRAEVKYVYASLAASRRTLVTSSTLGVEARGWRRRGVSGAAMIMLDRALRYARAGWPVFPLAPGEKRPLIRSAHPAGHACRGECGDHGHGLHDATADEGTIRMWWSFDGEPGANIGIRTGVRFWALDVDAKAPKGGGISGIDFLRELEYDHGELPATLTIQTPNGGQHRYFALPGDRTIPNRATIKREDGTRAALDVRGVGGYVVGEPSTVGGRPYAVVLRERIAAAPAWLLDLVAPIPAARTLPPSGGAVGMVTQDRYGQAALASACDRIRAAAEGDRHRAIYAESAAMGELVAGGACGLHRSACEDALVSASLTTGKSQREVQRTVRDGLSKGEQSPRRPEAREARTWRASGPSRPTRLEDADEGDAPELEADDHEDRPWPEHADEQAAEAVGNLTDLGNARRLVASDGQDFRWCPTGADGGWLRWDGSRWASDTTRAIHRAAKGLGAMVAAEMPQHVAAAEAALLARDPATEAGELAKARKAAAARCAKWAAISEGAGGIAAAITLASSEPSIVVLRSQLDTDIWTLNTPTATLALREAKWWEHRRGDMLTRCTRARFDPDATAPTWEAFIDSITNGDQALAGYLQRAAGYTLSGDNSEQVFFLLHGAGQNGKSTFLEALSDALGDYARTVPASTFIGRQEGAIPNDLAMLTGVRMVVAAEGEEGKRLEEALLKSITGGDTISARFMRGEFFDFTPQFKLWLSTNHKPTIRGSDEGIWRRIRLVPFVRQFAPKDRIANLKEKLRAERDGILRWMILGCEMWMREGMAPPAAIVGATESYRAEMDIVAEFLDEWTAREIMHTTLVGEMFAAFLEWCADNGERPRTQKWFSLRLQEKGLAHVPNRNNGRQWADVRMTRQVKARSSLFG